MKRIYNVSTAKADGGPERSTVVTIVFPDGTQENIADLAARSIKIDLQRKWRADWRREDNPTPPPAQVEINALTHGTSRGGLAATPESVVAVFATMSLEEQKAALAMITAKK